MDDVSVIALHTFPSIITNINTWLTFTDLSPTETTDSCKHFISSSTLSFSSFEVVADSLVNSIFSGLQNLVEDGRGFCHIVLFIQTILSGTRDVIKTEESLAPGSRNACLYELCPELSSNPHLLYKTILDTSSLSKESTMDF